MHARMLMFAARGEIRRTVRSTLTVPASGGIVQLRCSFARHTMINDNVNVATLWPHPQSRLSRRGSSTCTTRELSAGLLSAQMRDVHLYRAARSSDETRILKHAGPAVTSVASMAMPETRHLVLGFPSAHIPPMPRGPFPSNRTYRRSAGLIPHMRVSPQDGLATIRDGLANGNLMAKCSSASPPLAIALSSQPSAPLAHHGAQHRDR